MAKKVLVKETLTKEMKDAGSELVRTLDSEGIHVASSFWWYEGESKTWQLLIATPLLSDKGPDKAYATIQEILSKMPSDKPILALKHITLIKTDDPRASSLRRMVKTKAKSVSDVTVTASTIDGYYIDDAFIYRST
jgi:hypothetical protein